MASFVINSPDADAKHALERDRQDSCVRALGIGLKASDRRGVGFGRAVPSALGQERSPPQDQPSGGGQRDPVHALHRMPVADASPLFSAVHGGSELLNFNYDIVTSPSALAKAEGEAVHGVQN